MKRRDALTGDMFALPRPAAPVPGTMNFRRPVSLLLGDMLKDAHAAGLDRFEVAARASRLAGRTVSANMLDGYTAESREEFAVQLQRENVRGASAATFGLEQYDRMAELMAGLQGRAILTINDHPAMRERFDRFTGRTVAINYTVGGGKPAPRKERIYTTWSAGRRR